MNSRRHQVGRICASIMHASVVARGRDMPTRVHARSMHVKCAMYGCLVFQPTLAQLGTMRSYSVAEIGSHGFLPKQEVACSSGTWNGEVHATPANPPEEEQIQHGNGIRK